MNKRLYVLGSVMQWLGAVGIFCGVFLAFYYQRQINDGGDMESLIINQRWCAVGIFICATLFVIGGKEIKQRTRYTVLSPPSQPELDKFWKDEPIWPPPDKSDSNN